MEELAILAGIVVLGVPVCIIVLFVLVVRLRTRVAGLEASLARRESEWRQAAGRPEAAGPAPGARPSPPAAAEAAPPAIPHEVPAAEPVAAPAAAPASGPWTGLPTPAAPTPAREEQLSGPAATGAAPPVQRTSALATWLKANWVYAISAISLALAGIFFVQYGVERGLLPPTMRVIAAILFGAVLIAVGEVVRRRSGDGTRTATAFLPSTFSGAGLVSMFAGVLAARQLYGLVEAGTAFAGLLGVAVLAVVLGWFYGPFLAAVGVIGAAVAPFIVGGSSEDTAWLFAYFPLVAFVGLMIDTVRRWAWVSVLSLVVGYAGVWMTLQASGEAGWAALAVTALAVFAVLVPCLSLQPDHAGPTVGAWLRRQTVTAPPVFPVRLAAGALALTSALLAGLQASTAAESAMAFLCLAGLASAMIVWSRSAPGLCDLAGLPVAGYLARLVLEPVSLWPLATAYHDSAIDLRPPESAAPQTAALLLGGALVISLLLAWRSQGRDHRHLWSAAAAVTAPLAAVALELFWMPSLVAGSFAWALQVMGLAVVMAGLAVAFARADGDDLRRAAHATLATLSLIALALFLVLTKGALTLALAALVVVAAALDRRLRLPEMGLFIQAAIAGISWRLVIDPGMVWAVDTAALWEVLASYLGVVAAAIAGISLLRGLEGRTGARVFLESGGSAAAALLVNVLLLRWLVGGAHEDWIASHWFSTLNAMPWLVLALVQLHRLSLGGMLRWFRVGLASLAGLVALGGIASAVGPLSPMFGFETGVPQSLVYGPPVLDTLAVAYLLPALLLLAAPTRMPHLAGWLRWGMTAAGAALAALYVALEIRRLWQGDDLSVPGVMQGELYSYTIALMLLGAALLYQSLARGSATLRRAAMTVIVLTVAKVFLIDASGLSGLTRVFSFLALGLSLAGVAWLNRWAAGRQGGPDVGGPDGGGPDEKGPPAPGIA